MKAASMEEVYRRNTGRSFAQDNALANERSDKAVELLRQYHEAIGLVPDGELELLKGEAEQAFATASLCQERLINGLLKAHQ